MFSEVIILLGLASVTGYSLDLAAIAGIIAAVGTGVDDQIVITDEIVKKGFVNYNFFKKREDFKLLIILMKFVNYVKKLDTCQTLIH